LNDGDDLWEAARGTQKDAVASALARHDWTCANCGTSNSPDRNECASCGRPRVARARRFERGLKPWLLGAVALLAIAALAALLVPGLREDADEARAKEEARNARLAEQERQRLVIDSAPKRDVGPRRRSGEDALAYRERLLAHAASLVTADARERVEAGTMKGPVRGTECQPYPKIESRRQIELDPALAVGRYQCNAYRYKVELTPLEGKERTGLVGQPFWVVIEYPKRQISWCKVTPRAGEGGKVLAFVPVPEVCRDPPGPG
jgi:ribosomal protein L37E